MRSVGCPGSATPSAWIGPSARPGEVPTKHFSYMKGDRKRPEKDQVIYLYWNNNL